MHYLYLQKKSNRVIVICWTHFIRGPPSIQRCKACVMSAVGNHGLVLQHASKPRMNTEVVRAAVQNDGLALEFVEGTLNDNANIVNLAVGNNGLALQYASPRLKVILLRYILQLPITVRRLFLLLKRF